MNKKIAWSSFDHIIWDWNGTLIDDTWLFHEIVNQKFAENNVAPITLHEYRQRVYFPTNKFFQEFGMAKDDASFQKLAHDLHEEYERRRVEASLHPHASKILSLVTSRGKTQSILSAHPQEMLDFIVDHHALRPHFTDIIGHHHNLAHGKVDLARQWFETTSLSPDRILFIGDTDHDAEVARALGVACVLVAHGYQTVEKLTPTGATILHSLFELEDHLSR